MRKRSIFLCLILIVATFFAACTVTAKRPENVTVAVTDAGVMSDGGFVSWTNADPSKKRTVNVGDDVVFTPFVNSGWALDSFTVDGQEMIMFRAEDGTITLSKVKGDIEYAATFVRAYSLNVSANAGGEISVSAPFVKEGEDVRVTVTPDTGYILDSLIDNGEDVTDAVVRGRYTISSVSADHNVSAQFVLAAEVNVRTATSGGKIELLDEVTPGANVRVKATADAGYRLTALDLDGADVLDKAEDGVYTVASVSGVHTVTASFTREFKISQAVSGGEVGLECPAYVLIGETLRVKITSIPDGYRLVRFTVNGYNATSELSADLEYVEENIANDVVIGVIIKREDQIAVVQPLHGVLSVAESSCVPGDVLHISFVPDEHYELDSLVVDGVDITDSVSDNECAYVSTGYGAVVEATTRPVLYALSLTVPSGHGTARFAVGGKTVTSASVEDEVEIIAKANSGYELKSVTVGGEQIEINGDRATLPAITGPINAEVEFDLKSDVPFSGKAVYEDGTPVVGADVYADGEKKATTDGEGKFSFLSTAAAHEIYASAYGYVSAVVITEFASDGALDIAAPFVLKESTTKLIGATLGQYSSDFTGSTITYDSETGTEKITTTGAFSGKPLFLKDMQTSDGIVYFSVLNKTDTSGEHEPDPGIGVALYSPEFFLVGHVSRARTRFLPNSNYSTTRAYMPAVYVPSGEDFDIGAAGTREKHFFAFAKLDDTAYFLYRKADGKYRVISSYTTEYLDGIFAFALIGATNGKTSTVEINDLGISRDHSEISALLKASVEVASDGGEVSFDDPHAGKTVTFRVKANAGKMLSALTLNGTAIAFSNDEPGIYSAKATLGEGVNSLAASYVNSTPADKTITDGTISDDASFVYDSSIFYRNDQQIGGADPGAIYVSEEDDPVNGGWFYMVITGGNATQAFNIFRSKDLTTWKVCSDNGNSGFALKLNSATDWSTSTYWAPELMQETYITASGVKKNRYYIYYSALSKQGNENTDYSADDGDADATPNPNARNKGHAQYNRLYLGIGVSDKPQGPYTQVNTATYYKWYDDNLLSDDQPTKAYKSFYGAVGTSAVTGRTTNLNGNVANESAPPLNFYKYHPEVKAAMDALGAAYWPCIDISPFKDPATGNFYLYFSQHVNEVSDGNVIWVMKMKDYITPDFSTGENAMHIVALPGYSVIDTTLKVYTNRGIDWGAHAEYKTHLQRFSFDGTSKGAGINEGAHTIAHYDEKAGQWLYYLTYSPYGYGARAYSVTQAVSTSPFGPFVKLEPTKGVTVMGLYNGYNSTTATGTTGNSNLDYTQARDLSASIDYMAGTGHHCFVTAGSDVFVLYHSFPNPISNSNLDGNFLGRQISSDRLHFVSSPSLNYGDLKSGYSCDSAQRLTVLYGNGPTYSLQPKPSFSTGYENVAGKATVTSTGTYTVSAIPGPAGTSVTDSTEFLTDGLFVVHSPYKDWEYVNTASGNQTITLTFAEPQNARAVMVYNSAYYAASLKTLRSLKLYLTDGTIVEKTNLTQNSDNAYPAKKVMRFGGSIIADFDELSVNKIEITFNSEDKFDPSSSTVKIGDIAVLARRSGAAIRKVDYGQYGGANDPGFVLDGVADDYGWQDVKPYVYKGEQFSATVKAVPGKSGIYVTATVYDKALFHSDNSGAATTKFHGLNRWYKNTELDLFVFAGDTKNYTTAKVVSGRFSLYNMLSTWGMSGASSFVGDGNSKSNSNYSFTAEGFVSYADLGVTGSDVAYIAASYYRPENNKTNIRPLTFIGGDHRLISAMLVFDENGYKPKAVGYGASGDGVGEEIGEWKVVTDGVQSASTRQSATFIEGAGAENFAVKADISAAIGINPDALAGFTLSDGLHTYTYVLDLTERVSSNYINRLVIYSMTDYGEKEIVFDDRQAFTNDYRTKTLSLALYKKGNTIYISVNGKIVYFESDDRFDRAMSAGLYSRYVKTTFKNVEFTDYTDSADQLYETASLPLNVRFNTYLSAVAKVKGSLTESGFAAEVYAASSVNGKSVSSVKVNGETLTLNDGTGEFAVSGDMFVTVNTSAETSYKVSGTVSDNLSSRAARIVFKNGNKVYERYTKDGSYSLTLPSGEYEVTVRTPYRKAATTTVTVGTSAVTANLSAANALLGAAVDELDISASKVALTHSGETFSIYDQKNGISTWLDAEASATAVIDFTIESNLDTAGLTPGTYETSLTIGINYRNAESNSSIAILRDGVRALAKGNWNTRIDKFGLLSKNANTFGNVTRIRAVYLNDKWTLCEWRGSSYVKFFEYDCKYYGANTGANRFGIYYGTSFAINRVIMTNCAIVTDAERVQAIYDSLG